MGSIGMAFILASALQAQLLETRESLLFAVVPRQAEAQSCGYAVLAGLIRLLGASSGTDSTPSDTQHTGDASLPIADEASLIARYGGSAPEGAKPLSLLDMTRILADYGVSSVPVWIAPENIGAALSRAGLLILHYRAPSPHFILALGMEDGLIAVADPADGLTVLSAEELATRASGYALILSTDEPQRRRAAATAAEATHSAAICRRQLKTIAGDILRGGGTGEKGQRNFHMEVEFSASSFREESGDLVFSPSLFCSAEWTLS